MSNVPKFAFSAVLVPEPQKKPRTGGWHGAYRPAGINTTEESFNKRVV